MAKSQQNSFNTTAAAEYLSVHVETLRRMARKDEIPCFKMGRDWRYRKADLDNWIDSHHIRTQKKRVLIVDDETTILETFTEILSEQNYDILTATSGKAALELLKENQVDVTILDLNMPVMDGADTLKEIRIAHGNIPVIVVTGYPDSDMMHRALQHGPLTLITKPPKLSELIDAVEKSLR